MKDLKILTGTFRCLDKEKTEIRKPKLDFPLPAVLKGLAGNEDNSFPTMSEFFEARRKVRNIY